MARTANVGRISVSLDANTIRYINNIKKAQEQTEKRLDKMSSAFSRLRKSSDGNIGNLISKLGALGAAYLSVDFAMRTFNNQREILDQLAKTADALGIQQEKLQALQHVGELNGVTVVQLNLSLQRMQRNLGDAAKGTGRAAETLHTLGINIDQISTMKPDEQMSLLAKSLTSVERQTDKAKMAQDIFGRNGVRVLKVLEALKSEGLEPTAQALSDMGVALNRIDTAKVESANDAIFKVQEVLKGLANKLVVAISPVLEDVANKMIDMAKDAKGFAKEMEVVFEVLYRGFKGAYGIIKAFWNALQIAFHGWETIFNGAQAAAEDWGVQVAHAVMYTKIAFQEAAQGIKNIWNRMFATLKIKLAEWLVFVSDGISNLPFVGDMGDSMSAFGNKAIANAKKVIAATDKSQAEIDAAKAQRQKQLDAARMQVLNEYERRQQIINDKIKTNASEMLTGINMTSRAIFGDKEEEGEGGKSKADMEREREQEAQKAHLQWMLEGYSKYDAKLNQIRDESAEANMNRLTGDVDAIASAFGKQTKIQQTYAKATAAINAVLAAVQVWGDPSMTFYEKIPASIAATAAVMQLAGQFHGGTDSVPESMNNKSFMLKAGERVVQPEANKKLTNFLNDVDQGGGGMGGGVTINSNIEMGPSLVDEKVMAQALSKQQSMIAGLIKKEERKRPTRRSVKNQ